MKTFLTRFILLLFAIVSLYSCNSTNNQDLDDAPRRIEILFLGHAQEHHNSRKYMPILASALSQSGINLSYTEDPEDLVTKLALYDGLIIYANHDSITDSQEKSLLQFVSSGHAFIPIHSASFCFQNSPEYINLVGAQFKSHKTDTFVAQISDKNHPITSSLEEFSTWDETYVHDKIAPDINILMERVEGEHHEPWTWTKEYGNGKVFYTAYGHDERTWENLGFQKLIKQGILWAVAPKIKKNWEDFVKDIPILAYEEAANIPNYEKRDPAPKYQLPLTPEQSEKLIQIPPGFKLELFASEPDIINPIAMNWDESGRLWVIETVDYPNTVRDDKGSGDDRIKICEDTDGDGKADKFTIFADKLNIPTSFTFSNGGIIVSQAPQFLFLKDTDGDDIADIKEIIIDGWGVFDTHAGPSNLQNGIDNNIYGVVGYSGFKGQIFGKDQTFGQGIYRFNHNLSEFEFVTNTSNNTWGLGITEDNSIFASTANNTHSVFMGIPNNLFKNVEGIRINGSTKIDGHYAMLPITKNIRQVDVFGGFTAAAGHHFYNARTFPKEYWNKYAFVCEPTGGVVHIAKIEKDGAGYIEKDGGNLIASADEWFSPVEAKTGPDGSVWVLDWYNFIIQHNPTPRAERGGYDAENGKGNAYINPLRDVSRGRIWKISPKNSVKSATLKLDKNNNKELVQALSNENMFWRLTAQRLIIEKGDKDIANELFKLIKNTKVDEFGLNSGALHALWAIQGLKIIESNPEAKKAVIGALNHPSSAVRKAAIQILPKMRWADAEILKSQVLDDKDAGVQLAAILYFSSRESFELESSAEIGKMLYNLSLKDQIINDSWLSQAVYICADKHKIGFIDAFIAANPDYDPKALGSTNRESEELDDSKWSSMDLPQFIEDAGLKMDGVIWFRKTFEISKNDDSKSGVVSLGPVDDSDVVYINGVKIGSIMKNYQVDRTYDIAKGILKEGQNIIAVKVEDYSGSGGIYGKKDQMFLKVGSQKINLSGKWKYEVAEDYAKSSKNIFDQSSLSEVFVKNHIHMLEPVNVIADLDDTNITTINIKTIKNEMKFDITNFEVEAGKSIQIVLENVDFMQHNLVIIKPGTSDKVGAAADKLAADPKGSEKNYIPEMDEVLFATKLINPQETIVLEFIAPSEPGIYPFICTFPGHWRIMNGTMKVVQKKMVL